MASVADWRRRGLQRREGLEDRPETKTAPALVQLGGTRQDPDVDAACICFLSRTPEGKDPVSLTDEEVLSFPLETLRSQYAVDDVPYLSFIALGLAKAMEACPECMEIQGVNSNGCTEDRQSCNKIPGMR